MYKHLDWYSVRVTDQVTYVYNSDATFIGHYHGIAASTIVNTSAREAYTVWTDSRLYNNNQDYNIFYDRLTWYYYIFLFRLLILIIYDR